MFAPIVVKYGDIEREIPSNQFLQALNVVEDHLTYGQLANILSSGFEGYRYGKIALAYCAMLSFVGIKHDQADVLRGIISGETASDAAEVVLNLFNQLNPPGESKPVKKKSKTKTKKPA